MRLRSAFDDLRARVPQHLRWEPWSILVPLVVLQWLEVALIAHRAKHNGWLFAQDATATWNYTTAWILGSGHLPATSVGHGLPLLLAPVSWVSGPSLLDALHVIVSVQVLVLLPLGVLGAYVLGARSAGRLVGYLTAAAWTIAPWVSTHYFVHNLMWLDQILPMLVGLTALAYFPAMLVLMLAGVLVLRALDRRSWVDAGAAGAAAGLAIGIKPTNVLFLLAPLAAFLAARRWRELGAFAAAVAPCVLTYLLWRWKSVGHVGSLHDALLIPAPVQYTLSNLNIDFRFLNGLSWSPRVLEWIAVAGFIGLLKRSPVKAVFFGTWLLAYVLALGASRVTDSSGFLFWHVVSSAFPAFCVLAASVPLLWPRSMHGLSDRYSYRPRQLVPFAVPAVVAVVVPLVAVAALPRLHAANVAADLQVDNQLVPITDELHGRARVVSGRVLLSWKPASAKGVYAVYRAPARSSIEEEGLRCDRPGATRCALEMLLVATTGKTSLSEVPRPGNFTYRVAVRANYLGNDSPPGLFLSLSPPLDVDTR